MLASDHSSSGKSIQSYFAQKIKCKEGEEANESVSNKTLPPIRESESSPITTTPASNLAQGGESAVNCLTNILPSSNHAHNPLMRLRMNKTEDQQKA